MTLPFKRNHDCHDDPHSCPPAPDLLKSLCKVPQHTKWNGYFYGECHKLVLIIPNKGLIHASGMEKSKGLMSHKQTHSLLKSQ